MILMICFINTYQIEFIEIFILSFIISSKLPAMTIQPIQHSDIEQLIELQPPDWKEDIRPHFIYYLNSSHCEPIKILIKNKIAGIGTTFKHRNSAWLAHIIVHPEYRNKGIGKRITKALVDSIDKRKHRTIYLIATELGYPVYLKSGFEPEGEYAHFEFEPGFNKPDTSPLIIPYDEKYKSEIFELDKDTTGEFREAVLNGSIQNSFLFLKNGKVSGAYFPKLGDGLIIADDSDAGIELMKFRLQSETDAIFPIENKTAFEFYSEMKAKNKKTSKRMRYGMKRIWHPENLYNRIGGMLG